MIASRKHSKIRASKNLHNLGCTAIKYQITNPKLQINLKFQYTMTKTMRSTQL